MSSPDAALSPAACARCGTELAPTLLACPSCHRLVHTEALKRLADEAGRATSSRDLAIALAAWRRALELLPPESRQSQAISEKVAALTQQVDSPTTSEVTAPKPSWVRAGGVLGALTLLLWKFKFVLVFLAAKAKFLLGGLTKASTLLSMVASLGVYWAAWGWKFALGLVGSIYVHEMGHVAKLHKYGIKATAPMFVPGFGAFVRLKQYPANPREDARVGLAGPLWGLGAAAAAYAVFVVGEAPFWAAIAQWGARINLFNLVPLWQLDGGRGFRSLSQGQRLMLTALIVAALIGTSEGMLWLVLIGAGLRLFARDAPAEADGVCFAQYALLIVALSALCTVPVTGQPTP